MTASDLRALLPLIVLGAVVVVDLLVVAVRRRHRLVAGITLVGLAVALATLPLASGDAPRRVTPLLMVDRYALFYMGLVLAASLAVAMLSYGYLEGREVDPEAFYILLLLATLGAAVLVAASHLASFFLGLELLSVSLYALIAYPRGQRRPLEAGLKYLILAGASSAFLLFGMALTYAVTGTMDFGRIGSFARRAGTPPTSVLLAGLALLLAGVGFKLAVVPFHMWTPDVYEGAPAPVSGYVATVSKGAVFALLLRYFAQANAASYGSARLALGTIAVASMFAGNLLALLQDNVKRILAYSSIAHLGYLLVAFLAAGDLAAEAVAFYLVAYFVTTLGAFGVVAALSGRDREAEAMEDYRGLFWRRPVLACALTAMLFSLAGIPLTAGFVGKFFVLGAGVASGLWLLVLILVVNSGIGLFYYLRIVVAVFTPPSERAVAGAAAPVAPLSLAGGLALAALTFLLLWLGCYPAPIMRLIRSAVGNLI